MHVPLADQVACVERELKLREKHYPRWVRSQKLTQLAADVEIARLRAVLGTLQSLAGSGVTVVSTAMAPADLQVSTAVAAERERLLGIARSCMYSSSFVRFEDKVSRAVAR